MRDMKIITASALWAAALMVFLHHESAIAAKPTAEDLAHSDFQPDVLLARIIPEIQKTFVDPASTQQFQLCIPRRMKLENGRIVFWLVDFVANTRNASGGYAGRTFYTTAFKKGRFQIIPGTSLVGKQQGFDMLIAREMKRQTSDCPRIPDNQLKALLAR